MQNQPSWWDVLLVSLVVLLLVLVIGTLVIAHLTIWTPVAQADGGDCALLMCRHGECDGPVGAQWAGMEGR